MKGILSQGPRVLIVGYNGANNTGAEALLQADIQDIRAVLGSEAQITIPTLNEANLRRYLSEGPRLTIRPISTLFFGAIHRMVRESDLVLLAEGSTYMDTWGSPLLWFFLWATNCAAAMGKPSLAYAVDAGSLTSPNARRVRRIASRTDLIITRSEAAAGRLRHIGVTAPMTSTADNAFTFEPEASDLGWPAREWPRSDSGMVGLAVVDFSLFPAVVRPWGKRDLCYKWPYYLASSPARRGYSEKLARTYAALADHVAATARKSVALICMEQLDEPMAGRIHTAMSHPERARIFSARRYNASQMTVLLRSLDLLVTSRFHAAVLSLAGAVPQVALHHDSRLSTLYEDLGLKDHWFIDPRVEEGLEGGTLSGQVSAGLRERVDELLAEPDLQKKRLERGHAEHLARARRNRKLLESFAARHFPVATRCKRIASAAHGGAAAMATAAAAASEEGVK